MAAPERSRDPPGERTEPSRLPGGRLHAISLAFSRVEEGRERVPSELLLVAFSRHGASGVSVAPPSSSQFRTAVAPRPVSVPAGSAHGSAPASRERLYAA